MLTRIKYIFIGWWLWIKDDKATRQRSRDRMTVCGYCQHRNKWLNTCNECGCFLPAKTRVEDAQCPHEYW